MTARQEATRTETIATTVVFRKASVTLVLDQSVRYGLKLRVSQRIFPCLISTSENSMLMKTGA